MRFYLINRHFPAVLAVEFVVMGNHRTLFHDTAAAAAAGKSFFQAIRTYPDITVALVGIDKFIKLRWLPAMLARLKITFHAVFAEPMTVKLHNFFFADKLVAMYTEYIVFAKAP